MLVTVDSRDSSDPDGEITSRILRVDDAPPTDVPALHTLMLDAEGSHTLRLQIVDDDGDGTSGAYVVTVDPPAAPEVDVTADDPIELRAPVNGTDSASFLVANTGTADLTATLSVSRDEVGSSTPSVTVAPGGSVAVPLTLSCGPTAVVADGTVTLASNDPDEASIDLPFTIECVDDAAPPPAPEISVAASDPIALSAFVNPSTSSTFAASSTFAVSNTGDADLDVDLSTSRAVVTTSPANLSVPAGATVDVSVTLTCGATPLSGDASVGLTTNDEDEAVIDLPLEVECLERSASAGAYRIDVIFEGDGATPERQAVFQRAAERWGTVITGDTPDAYLDSGLTQDWCGTGNDYSGDIDDLVIIATLDDIDGENGTLAMAGACLSRTGSGHAALGVMIFDTADMDAMEADGTLEDVVLHEMGHVVGITATTWIRNGMFDTAYADADECLADADPHLVSTNVVRENQALGEAGPVKIEDDGIRGTGCSHFDDDLYVHELMTGYVSPGGMPLSRLTIAALDDAGYEVDYAAADPYAVPSSLLGSRLRREATAIDEIILEPRGAISPDGTFTPFD